MIYQQQHTFEEYRQVRFIQMEEDDNGETEVVFVSDQHFTAREVIGGVFSIPGCPKPYLIEEDDGAIIERKIHHINTRFSSTIDVYYQEFYTDMVSNGIPQELNQYVGKTARIQFFGNGVRSRLQLPTNTIQIDPEMEEVWYFAIDHFFTNQQAQNDDVLVLRMEYEENNILSRGYDGTLKIHYDFLTMDETYLESFCEVCETHFDGRDNEATDNHQRCVDEAEAQNATLAAAQNSSDPDASNADDGEEEETDAEEEEETDTEEEETDAEEEAEADAEEPINEQYDETTFHANSEIIPIQNIGQVFNFNNIHDFNNTNFTNYTGHGLIGDPVMGQ